jgi:hypothetical protein
VQRRAALARLGGTEQAAAGGHLGRHKCLEYVHRLRAPGGHPQTRVNDRNARRLGDFAPHVAAAPSARPHQSAFLSAHGDETEIAHRSAVRLRIPVYDDDPQAAAGSGQSGGKSQDARAYNGQIKALGKWVARHRVRHLESPLDSIRKENRATAYAAAARADGGLTRGYSAGGSRGPTIRD